ncbi:MAG TPA: hypothetical protein VHO84_15055 [Syntrophorhabdaceae bacterium]|nr:hypothetical protein [Syntrophorhabdaceae bacterium]
MSRHIAASFENECIKVVHADVRDRSISITQCFTFSNTEFDQYLHTSRDDEFIVVSDFQNVYQDIISVPPAQERYLRTLVELEIRKRLPELKDFVFFYEELRDIQKEGKRSKDIFFYALSKEDVDALVERFKSAGKLITHLYPNVLPLTRFLHIDGIERDKPVLGVVDLGTNKTMFLMANKKLNFVRVAQSVSKGFNTNDLENINMTVAYCRQVLRVYPERVAFSIGSEKVSDGVSLVVPVAASRYPDSILAPADTLSEYILPTAALTEAGELTTNNLLPIAYQGIGAQRRIMAAAIAVLIFFLVIGLGYSAMKATAMIRTRAEINDVRREIAQNRSAIIDYERSSAELQKTTSMMNFMNAVNSTPDMQRILLSLQVFSRKTIDTKIIALRDEQEGMLLQVEGSLLFRSYRELQSNYEEIIAAAGSLRDLEVVEESLDLKTGNFKINLKWKT